MLHVSSRLSERDVVGWGGVRVSAGVTTGHRVKEVARDRCRLGEVEGQRES